MTTVAAFLVAGEAVFWGFFRCPFAVPFVNCGTCPVVACPAQAWRDPFMWALIVLGLVIGRAFCGWLCPLGFIEDLLGALPKPRFLRRPWFRKVDEKLKLLKYPMAMFALYLIFMGNHRVAAFVRTGSWFSWTSLRVTAWEATPGYWFRIVLGGIAVVGGALLIGRIWCRYLCPLGALVSLTNKFSLFRLRIDESKCTHCDKCYEACPMDTYPSKLDCTLCTDCIPACPEEAISAAPRVSPHRAHTPVGEKA